MSAAPAKTPLPVDSDAALDAELEAARTANRLRREGFTLSFTGETLHVAPSSKLDLAQRQALKAHKAQIITLLRIEARPAIPPAPITWSKPQPLPPPVACGDCRHSSTAPQSDPVFGWRRCGLGIDGGGGFGRADRQCARFEGLQQEAETKA